MKLLKHTLACTFVICIHFYGFSQEVEMIEESSETVETTPVTTLTFEEIDYDFGKVNEGDMVTHIFKFTNTGNIPLVISRASGSCGCTVPYFPSAPIMPGKSSEIEVNFNSTGRVGMQHKTVTVHANTAPSVSILKIKGQVLPSSKSEENAANNSTNKQNQAAALHEKDENCIAIFPNPTNEILQLDLKKHIGKSAKVTVRNDAGKTVLQKNIENISHEATQLNVSSFASGMYFISILVDGKSPMTQCFVVAHQ